MTKPSRAEPRSPVHRRLFGVLIIGALAVTTSMSAVVGPAVGAAPIDDKKKQAAALEADIAAKDEAMAVLYEQIKLVQTKLDEATQTIVDAQSRIAGAQAETQQLLTVVRRRAASVYRSASRGSGDTIFDVDVSKVAPREKYSAAASERDDAIMQQLAAARAELRARQNDAEEAKQAAEAQKAQLDTMRADFEAGQAERQRLLGQVQGEIKTLVDQAAQERAAKEAPKPSGGGSFDPGQLPPVSGSAGVAVGYAQAQLGKPYCYAGTGPDCYDCSGLTMMSWGAAGVGLPHNSESQYNSLPHVPMDQLAAGDVVWYPGHVGLYAGGGAVIHASSSNNAVTYQSVSYYQGGARPG